MINPDKTGYKHHVIAGRNTVVPDDIKTHVTVAIAHFTSIASGLTIVSGNHPPVANRLAVSNFPFKEWGWGDYSPSTEKGGVSIGSDVWIGENVTIMDGIWIGDGSIIAAGSVVTKSIGAYQVWGGNPAEYIRHRFQTDIVDELMQIKWWNWSDEKIKKAIPFMRNVEDFVRVYYAIH